MEKRKDIQIFIMCHKVVPYGLRNDSLYTPLEVGAATRDIHCAELKDNVDEDNISIFNPYYSELTGQYLLWKRIERGEYTGQYIGQEQYRRRLEFQQYFDFSQIFRHYSVIGCKPINFSIDQNFGANTLYKQFGVSHNTKYLDVAENIIKKDFTLIYQNWDKYIKNGNLLYYSNSYILPTSEYCKYNRFLFCVLKQVAEIENLVSAQNIEERVKRDIADGVAENLPIYQKQIFSFLAERLWTLWVRSNYEGKIFEVPYTLMENSGI